MTSYDPPPLASPEERVELEQFANRTAVRVTLTHRNVRGDLDAPEHGSGSLVRLGGRDFVFTVGHLGELAGRYDPRELTVTFPTDRIIVPRSPGNSILRIWGMSHPDVAAIELDLADRRAIWNHMEPLGTDDMLDWRQISSTERVIVLGLPFELTTEDGSAAGGMGAITRIVRETSAARTSPKEGTASTSSTAAWMRRHSMLRSASNRMG